MTCSLCGADEDLRGGVCFACASRADGDDASKRLARLDAVLAPHQERFRAQGLDECTALAVLLAADQFLIHDPVGALEYLARHYHVGGARPDA